MSNLFLCTFLCVLCLEYGSGILYFEFILCYYYYYFLFILFFINMNVQIFNDYKRTPTHDKYRKNLKFDKLNYF